MLTVDTPAIFRIGDLVQPEGSDEILQVTAVGGSTITVTRGYGGTTAEALADNQRLIVLGHAALEGEDAAAAAFQNRVRRTNYTQIFTETIHVSGTMDAVTLQGVDREFDYQAINRVRELLRSLEQSVIAGVAASATPEGSDTVRRTMGGILSFISGASAITKDAAAAPLDEPMLNGELRRVWEAGGRPNAIVVGGFQKRQISTFAGNRQFQPDDRAVRNVIEYYESDFGLQQIVLSRWVPADKVLLLDLMKLHVLPLSGRSFALKELAPGGDYRRAQLLGEYTLEMHNGGNGGHGLITNLATS